MTYFLVLISLAAILAAVCVTVEFAARAAIRRSAYYVFPPGLRLRMRPDPETFPQLERATRFDVNTVGERGRELPVSDNLYRVLVAGGSQPEGFLLDQDTTWPGALQCLLDAPERRRELGATHVHVGSIARSGVGSEALELIFKRVLPRYPRLQLIIIMVGATDVLRWLEQGAPEALRPVDIADVFRCHPEMTFGWTPLTLATGELLRRARRQWWRPLVVHDKTGRWIAKARMMRAEATDVRTEVPDPSPMLKHFRHHFNRVIELAKANADRVLVIRQPWFDGPFTSEEAAHMWHGAAGQVWREKVGAFYSFEVCSTLMHLLDAHAEVIAAAHDIEQVDLMPWLDRSLTTYYDGFHLTPAGARAVAGSVAAATLAQHAAAAMSRERIPATNLHAARVRARSFQTLP
jgi:lysophospholipase L1-like esterase